MENSIVISVNTPHERDEMVKNLYTTLTDKPDKQFTIVKDRINRIRIYHNKKNTQMLISTYVVIILPVLLDFSPLSEVYGTVDFRLDATIERLVKLLHKLQSMQGKKVVNGQTGADKLRKALTSIL